MGLKTFFGNGRDFFHQLNQGNRVDGVRGGCLDGDDIAAPDVFFNMLGKDLLNTSASLLYIEKCFPG
jgi:hypothetical protein